MMMSLLSALMKFVLSCRVMFVILIMLSSATSTNVQTGHGKGAEYQHIKKEEILEHISWHPYSGLNPYHRFDDVKIYIIHVPVYTSEMGLLFQYAYYSNSDKACNNTVTILLQHGSPAVPYRDEIHTKSWFYKNTDTYKTVVSLGKSKATFIKSPLPGYWYVTTFLPPSYKVKKITEQGLTKSDGKCYCAINFTQVLTRPVKSAQVIGKGQNITDVISNGENTVRYYQYFIPDYSRNLKIEIKRNCLSQSQQCSIKLSVSAKSLPSFNSTSCIPNVTCVLNIEWPQSGTNYYLEVRGVNASYHITADHTDCESNNSSCYPVVEMKSVHRVHLRNNWGYYSINQTKSFFSLNVEPNYVGTTLGIDLLTEKTVNRTMYEMCITKNSLPFDVFENGSNAYCRTWNDSEFSVEVLFPQAAKWYIAIGVHSSNETPTSYINVYTKTCLDTSCNGHGNCVVVDKAGITYGVCDCDYGYSGWTCEKYHGLDILAICLLTISNIAFLPGVFLAFKRKFYPETIVYLFNMYCSTVYHACDSHGFCIYEYHILQLSDFFSSTLSVWYTLMAMVKFSVFWHRTVNILALLCIFVGIQVSLFGITMIAVPAGIGIAAVLLSFVIRSRSRRKCFPSPRRWLLFIVPAVVLALVAIIVYTLLETTANYKYLHSFWHVGIALSIPLLLPSVRKSKLFAEYNMIQTLDDGEHFRNSQDSLLLNQWDKKENDDNSLDDDSLPKLI